MACLFYTCTSELCIPFQIKLPKADGVCQLCELAVSFIKPYVDSNTTQVRKCLISLYVYMCVDKKHMSSLHHTRWTQKIKRGASLLFENVNMNLRGGGQD